MVKEELTSNIAAVVAHAISSQTYVLRLYVSGTTPRSRRFIQHIDKACKEQLDGKYDLEVVDIQQHPFLAKDEQIIATRRLVKLLPPPLRRIVGAFSDCDRVLFGMDIIRKPDSLDSKMPDKQNRRDQRANLAK